MGTPKGLFHHQASLAWGWEETRFRGWRAFAPHRANGPTAADWRGAGAHIHHTATTTTVGSRATGVARARDGNPHGDVAPPGLARMGVGGAPVSWLVPDCRAPCVCRRALGAGSLPRQRGRPRDLTHAWALTHYTIPTGPRLLIDVAQAPHTHHGRYQHGSRPTATGWRGACARDGTPKGLFHNRASLAWEWEEPQFRGWRALTLHHANRP